MRTPELNLHTNYDCPLNCRYCVQRGDLSLNNQFLTAEEMIQKVQEFLDYIKKPFCHVNISGGEPLLKFKDIQKLLEHFPQNSYEISTSGILLTEDKAKYFSKFNVAYILSVDGTEKATNYLRPLANGKTGYFKQLKKNIPHILYYAPKTRAKLIVPKILISEIFSTYLELERLGFNTIFITPNVFENEVDNNHPELQTGSWDAKDWLLFEEQINKIHTEISLGLKLNKKRCLITNILLPATKMICMDPKEKFNENKMICNVLSYRAGIGPAEGQFKDSEFGKVSVCIRKGEKITNQIKTQEELVQKAFEDFNKLTGICPNDPTCPYQNTCIYSTCIAENLKDNFENMWVGSRFQCLTQKIYQKYASYFLTELYNNLQNPVSLYYLNIIEEGRKNFNGVPAK